MNYQSFVKLIEKFEEIDEKQYKTLIEVYGEEKINNYFEKYIEDVSSIDDNNIFNKIKYYLKKTNHIYEPKEIMEVFSSIPNFDSVRMYLKEISTIPSLTTNEEYLMLKNIDEKSKYLEENNITLEFIYNNLKYYNIELNGDFSDKIFNLNKRIVELKSEKNIYNEANILKMKSLLQKMQLYENYKKEKDRFTKANLRLVVSIAKKYVGRGIEFLDLIQEGNLGLDKAINKYDINKGYKFSTYATWWIRQKITRALSEKSKTIRIPTYLYEIAIKVKLLENELVNVLGRNPSDREIYIKFKEQAKKELIEEGNLNPSNTDIKTKLGFDEEKIMLARKYNQHIVSLNSTIGEDDDMYLENMIIDEEKPSIENEVLTRDLKNIVKKMIKKEELPIYRLIIILRFGLKLNDFFTYEDFSTIIKDKYKKYLENIKYNVIMKKKPQSLKSDNELKRIYIEACNRPKELTLEQIGELLCITKERVRQLEAKALRRLKNDNRIERNNLVDDYEQDNKPGFRNL